jgi:flagellin-like protein
MISNSNIFFTDDSGFSPVIGVILMVAVTIALVALVTVVVFDLGQPPSEPAEAQIKVDKTDTGIQVNVLRNQNVQSIILRHPDGGKTISGDIGTVESLDNGNGEYEIIGVINSEKQVLKTVTVQDATTSGSIVSGDTIEGTIERNPPIPNAVVKAYNTTDGTLVNQTTTDTNGEYRLTFDSTGQYEIVVQVDGEQLTIGGQPTEFYAGDTSIVETGNEANFDFIASNEVSCLVDGSQETVNFGVTDGQYQVTTPKQTYCIDDMGIDGQYELAPTIQDTTDDGLSDYRQTEILGTDPALNDTTGDGLNDSRQVHNIGTDPTLNDTSGDGFPDKVAVNKQKLDPTQKNVLVEVDYMSGVHVPTVTEFKSTFENAPITNNYGDNGINLEVVISDTAVNHRDKIDINEYVNNYYLDNSIYKNQNDGYYHILMVDEIVTTGGSEQPVGITSTSITGMMVQDDQPNDGYQYTDTQIQGIMMHELGHQLGLLPSTFDGVDSLNYDCSNYNSVMNYDAGCFGISTSYSSSAPHDDWSVVENNLQQENPIQTNIDY